MTRYDHRTRILAAALSALAGFVDAVGYTASGGYFISFMSGNSTRLGVGLAAHTGEAAIAAGLILSFLMGVTLGSWIGARAGDQRRGAVLGSLVVLTLLASIAATLGCLMTSLVLLAVAMGAENAVFEEDGEIRIGLTYMTGTLVKMGQRLAAALHGGARFGWWPYLVQWGGLLIGAIMGAMAYHQLGLGCLWLASGTAGLIWLAGRKRVSSKA